MEFQYQPLISIVVPVFQTPIGLLQEMIDSVIKQSYKNWELCIGNASPENERLSEELLRYAGLDSRIKIKNIETNLGISGNTNLCFELVKGEYTAMLDHDDLLTENALYEVVKTMQGAEKPEFIYSDQDMVDESSTRFFNPLRKPKWSFAMLYSGNYITHFSVIKTELIQKAGGWDSQTDGAQDWDLFLKISELTDKICGIPQILYHWRMAATSTASSMETKSYALDAQIRSLNAHFARIGMPKTKAYFYDRSIFKIKIAWDQEKIWNTSLIVLDEGNCNHIGLWCNMAAMSLKKHKGECILLSKDPRRLEEGKQYGFQGILLTEENREEAFEKGMQNSSGEILLCMTDAVRLETHDTLEELIHWAAMKKTGIAGPVILEENGCIKEMGRSILDGQAVPMFSGMFKDGTSEQGKMYWYRNVHAMDPNCFSMRRAVYDKWNRSGTFRTKADVLRRYAYLEQEGYRHVVSPYAVIKLHEKEKDF